MSDTAALDEPRKVRKGEELDAEKLSAWLRAHVPELAGVGAIEIEQFPSGHSNLTYFLRGGEGGYVLRRPPFGSKVKSAHDMGREYRVLSRLHAAFEPAPEPLAYCEDESVIGSKFYLMRRVHGIILRKDLPSGLELGPAQLGELCRNLVDNLVRLHAVDYRKAGLADLGKPEGYVERQVRGWTERYTGSQTDEIESVIQVAKWLAERMPKDNPATLIHNDYKLDNVVLDPKQPTRIIGVLDWEMSTLGDPLMDLGTTLSYWVEADDPPQIQVVRWGPTALPGALTRAELAARYAEQSGRDVSNALFYYCFGLFKTAVVIQQIYYRYKQGLTKDERFAPLIHGVRILCDRAAQAIELGRI
jgi:aminoglycoside phosphotransferase (APT) family kinase protein